MIRYYNNDEFLGYLVGTCPKTGKSVVVDDDLKYFTPDVITHKVVGEAVLDERTTRPKVAVRYNPFTELPTPY